ncbi:MAG: Wzy polymerase domain-containing protein [Ramlibacter sp.]
MPWLVSAFCGVLAFVLWQRSAQNDDAPHDWVRVLAASWLAAACISSVIALLQYFGIASHFAPLMSGTSIGEAFGNLRQRNQFASLTGIGVAALLWWAPRLDRRVAVAAMVLLATANAASASRTGLLELVMLAAFAAAWPSPHRMKNLSLWLAGAVAYLAAALLLPLALEASTGVLPDTVWGRITRGDGCSSRAVLWSNVLHLTRQVPWLGWGWGELDFAHYMTLYSGDRFCDILDNAHNLPLHLAVELGVPAALLACGALLWAVVRARPWRETDAARQMAWGVLAVILLHSMLEYPLWYGPFQIAFLASLGLVWPAMRRASHARPSAPTTGARARAGVALALLAAIGYAGWDYHRISQIYLPAEARSAHYRDDTLQKINGSWLFSNQVDFAELTITPLSRENAQWTFDTGLALLHFSPEPRVIEKVIESAVMLGRDDVAQAQLARFRAAFPAEHARWAEALACSMPAAQRAPDCEAVKD